MVQPHWQLPWTHDVAWAAPRSPPKPAWAQGGPACHGDVSLDILVLGCFKHPRMCFFKGWKLTKTTRTPNLFDRFLFCTITSQNGTSKSKTPCEHPFWIIFGVTTSLYRQYTQINPEPHPGFMFFWQPLCSLILNFYIIIYIYIIQVHLQGRQILKHFGPTQIPGRFQNDFKNSCWRLCQLGLLEFGAAFWWMFIEPRECWLVQQGEMMEMWKLWKSTNNHGSSCRLMRSSPPSESVFAELPLVNSSVTRNRQAPQIPTVDGSEIPRPTTVWMYKTCWIAGDTLPTSPVSRISSNNRMNYIDPFKKGWLLNPTSSRCSKDPRSAGSSRPKRLGKKKNALCRNDTSIFENVQWNLAGHTFTWNASGNFC